VYVQAIENSQRKPSRNSRIPQHRCSRTIKKNWRCWIVRLPICKYSRAESLERSTSPPVLAMYQESSTHSKKFWRLESNETPRTRIPKGLASRSGRGILSALLSPLTSRACRELAPRTKSREIFQRMTLGRPVRRREHKFGESAPWRIRPRGQNLRNNPRTGIARMRRPRRFAQKIQMKCCNQRRRAIQNHYPDEEKKWFHLSSIFLVRELRHRHASRRRRLRAETVSAVSIGPNPRYVDPLRTATAPSRSRFRRGAAEQFLRQHRPERRNGNTSVNDNNWLGAVADVRAPSKCCNRLGSITIKGHSGIGDDHWGAMEPSFSTTQLRKHHDFLRERGGAQHPLETLRSR